MMHHKTGVLLAGFPPLYVCPYMWLKAKDQQEDNNRFVREAVEVTNRYYLHRNLTRLTLHTPFLAASRGKRNSMNDHSRGTARDKY